MLLMKVGKQAHLEQLQKGCIHFNPLSLFRNDGTAYRGDALEGSYRIDTTQGLFVDGVDISKFGSGLEVTFSYQHSDAVLIFCAAVLDEDNSIIEGNRVHGFREEFLLEMRKFGRYAVLFWSDDFVSSLSKKLNNCQCNYGYNKIEYIDKWNFDSVSNYFQDMQETFGNDAIFFLKDPEYKKQNEWRFIIDCVEGFSTITKNENGSLDIAISPFPVSDIIDLDTFAICRELNE